MSTGAARRQMPWLKLWTEARNDGKLRCLTDSQHRVWFRLLCFVAEQEPAGTVRGSWKLIAAECADGDVDRLRESVTEMESLLLVTCVTCNANEVEITFPSYAKRQAKYPSDARDRVAGRVAKHRASKKLHQNGQPVTRCNEPVTSSNAQEVEEEGERESVCVSCAREGDDLRDWEEAIAELQGDADLKLIGGMLQESAEVPSIRRLDAWRFIHAAHVIRSPGKRKTWEYFVGIANRASRREFDAWRSPPQHDPAFPAKPRAAPSRSVADRTDDQKAELRRKLQERRDQNAARCG